MNAFHVNERFLREATDAELQEVTMLLVEKVYHYDLLLTTDLQAMTIAKLLELTAYKTIAQMERDLAGSEWSRRRCEAGHQDPKSASVLDAKDLADLEALFKMEGPENE